MGKTDRMARLLHVLYILNQNPQGIAPQRVADQCGVTIRTTYRDLQTLEDREQLNVPIWGKKGKRGIEPGCFLPPISFSLSEATTIFLASRLLLGYTNAYNPNIASTFMKLNSVVPGPLRDQIRKTIEWMQKQPKDERYLRILATLAEAWTSQHQVKISYQALAEKEATERIIEPYFIEPAAPGHSSYVIAYCHRTKSLRTFKVERIEAIEATSEPYVIPPDFDANAYLGSSWGIVVKDEVETIKLKFTPEIARIMEETVWHPSQVLELQSDGSIIMTLSVTNTVELYSWILGWGEKVEVLEPEELRRKIVNTSKAMLDIYHASQ